VPLKIKVFMWFLHKKVLLTKDNLIKRKWQGSDTCCFCDKKETVQHLFLQCPLAKVVCRIVHMAFSIIPPKNIIFFLIIGWWGFRRLRRLTLEWEHVLYFGPYGGLGMIIYLTMQNLLLLCR
jgi:hypothetical protein